MRNRRCRHPTPRRIRLRLPLRPPFQTPISAKIFIKIFVANKAKPRDPTGSVEPDSDGALEALHIYEQIIHDNPDWNDDEVSEELVKQVYTDKKRRRVEGVFHWVRLTLENWIRAPTEVGFQRPRKKQLKNRVEKIELQLPPPASLYSDEPDLYIKNDVFYERTLDGKTRLRVGGAYLFTAKSRFNLTFTIAHELAHSIDPCEIRAFGYSYPAYDRLSACFMHEGLVKLHKARSECGDNDQLSETFADWVAVQITAEALRSFATEFHGPQILSAAINSVRDLCDEEETINPAETDYHPSPRVRIDRIFGRNREIRKFLGCAPVKTGPDYCTMNFRMPKFR